jgi:DnaK suppressor protein
VASRKECATSVQAILSVECSGCFRLLVHGQTSHVKWHMDCVWPTRTPKPGVTNSIAKRERSIIVKKKLLEELEATLRRKRSALLQDVTESLVGMQPATDERESEFEESAQKDLMTKLVSRLKERDQRTIREIDAALDRIAAGVYGECARCENEIGIGRLRALPTTMLCIDCATAREKRQQALSLEGGAERYIGAREAEEEFDTAENDG